MSWAPSKIRGAFDFEAWQWTNPKCCGLLTGPRGAREWDFICDETSKAPLSVAPRVLRAMLSRAESDSCFDWWAHNGGRYDFLFLLEAAVALGWNASGHVAAGRAVVLYLQPPTAKRPIRLYDSQALLPGALKRIAVDFELESRKLFTVDDYSVDVRKWKRPRLEAGCRTDCECVLEALERVEVQLEEWGGELRATFSSSALSVLESTTELPDMLPHRAYNEIARQAYCGGRVEVFHHNPGHWLAELDVCSSYPWSLSQPLPFHPLGIARTRAQVLAVLEERGVTGVVRAQVTVPQGPLPPLPWIHPDGGVYFPTGSWDAWFTVPELRYARDECRVQVEPIEAIMYSKESPFEGFVAQLYEVKRNAKGAKRAFAKLMLNGCYGKFAQKPEKENLQVFADRNDALDFLLAQPPDTVRLLNGSDERFMAITLEKWSKRTHYALAATVTARSRVLLHKALSRAGKVAYCDTDSVHCELSGVKALRSMGGLNLGELDLHMAKMKASYWAPKIYELHAGPGLFFKDTDGQPVKDHYACKGFPVDRDTFRKVVRGEEITRERMRLIKRQLKKGEGVQRETDAKTWSQRSMKRRPEADGATVPWTVEELLRNEHLKAFSPLAKRRS